MVVYRKAPKQSALLILLTVFFWRSFWHMVHMRYHVLATDYDGTLASQGQVSSSALEKLEQLKATGRRLVLVTGREMKDLLTVFPAYDPHASKRHILKFIARKYTA
jgi:hypothetical protein